MSHNQTSHSPSPFIIGIDLGTTNCAVAYINTALNADDHIEIFQIPQLAGGGNIEHFPLLPSYLYLAGQHELLQENISLPWNENIRYVVGEFGKKLGAQVPARLVSSAKSWLCHSGVNRQAAILPWGGGRELTKLSPVEASSCYIQHIKEAWNYEIAKDNPEHLLENQEVILTVPASFDEAARELTLEAAQKAGLKKITLLEEPQAAFYCWITDNRHNWHQYLRNGQIILICDMGGGTTDFSLITVQEEGGKPLFTRVAVGDHLILGGDNIDLALARHVEIQLVGQPEKLDMARWAMLSHNCRFAKEQLLSEEQELMSWPIVIQDKSSRLISSTLKYELHKNEVIDVIENGFFPFTELADEPAKISKAGLQEWGLPYVQDTALTKHLSSFLRRHQSSMREIREKTGQPISDFIMPDAILFNGGALKPQFLRQRVTQVMDHWFLSTKTSFKEPPIKDNKDSPEKITWSPLVLSNSMFDLAVAYGAAYYGAVRRGKGIRISGGLGRSYYIGLGTKNEKSTRLKEQVTHIKKQITQQSLCVVPRKMEEGQEVEIKDKEFILLIGEPVSFPLFTSSTRLLDQAGDILTINDEEFETLPAMQTILRRGRAKLNEVPVHLQTKLTEIGTLEIWCVSRDRDRQWKLQFGIREEKKPESVLSEAVDQEKAAEDEILDVERVKPLLLTVFGTGPFTLEYENVGTENLFKYLEKALHADRQSWPVFTLRRISEMLLEPACQKDFSALHEARWLNLVGFCLRPGFGYSMDEWRIKKVWKVFSKGATFAKDRETRTQWWILWRRVAGGLNQNQQAEVFRKIAAYLLPQKKAHAGPKPSSHELAEIWRLAASLELLNQEHKEEMGNILLDRLSLGKSLNTDLWALARLGTRQPLYGSVHTAVTPDVAEKWIIQLLNLPKLPQDEKVFTLTQLGRKTGDRARDITEEIRNKIIAFLSKEKENLLSTSHSQAKIIMLDQAIQSIEEVSLFQFREQNLIFGESLPKGLQPGS